MNKCPIKDCHLMNLNNYRAEVENLRKLHLLSEDLALKINLAFIYARGAHGLQKWGPHPYLLHLIRVFQAAEVRTRNFPVKSRETVLLACILHDTLEDTEIKPNEIQTLFGKDVALAVEMVTDPEEGTREEKKEIVFKRLAHSLEGSMVKLCDRLVNVSFTVEEIQEGKDSSRFLKSYSYEQPALSNGIYKCPATEKLISDINEMFSKVAS